MSRGDPVRTKLREASSNFDRLASIERSKEFYPAVNAFLTAARSVLYVARHELGWKDRLSAEKVGFSPGQVAQRRRFDAWYDTAPEVKAVLAHPLAGERHEVVHRSGQAGFRHTPKPSMGLAVGSGDAERPARVIRAGRLSLPIADENVFHYVDATGRAHEARAYCEQYLELITAFFVAVDRGVWR